MKTPRFFIVLAACAVVFTIASTSIESAFRPCRAETLPVLRLDPRMGDPDLPGVGYEIPFEDSYEYSRVTSLETQTQSLPTIHKHKALQLRFYRLLPFIFGRRW